MFFSMESLDPWAGKAMLVWRVRLTLLPLYFSVNGCFRVWAAGTQHLCHLSSQTVNTTIQVLKTTVSNPGFYKLDTLKPSVIYMGLLHALHHVKKKGPSNVKSLTKSSKSVFILSSVDLRGPLTRQIPSQWPPGSPFLVREAGLELGCERCGSVFCRHHFSTTQWDTARGQRERMREPQR